MSKEITLVATRAQREAVYRLFKRHYWDQMSNSQRESNSPCNIAWRRLYRLYRKRFAFTGYGSDWYLFGQPFNEGEGQLFVGIEFDGYTHS